MAKWKSSTLNPSNWIQFAYDLLLPPAGHRGYLDGEQGGDYRVRFQWIYANLQTSYQNGYISASSTNVFYWIDGEGSMIAFSVRCMKNTNNSDTLTLHPNGWTKAVIAFTGDVGNWKFSALWTPIRDSHSIFEWWYSTSNFAAWTQVIKWSVVPADLYAKWSCDTGYVETIAGDGCTKIYTITYNLNGWTNNVNNPAKYTVESWAITLQSPTKVWYTFLWWTWSNGSIPQTSVTIPTWSTGDRIYNANWQANTNTDYTVYHYVKKVWSGTYELALTEPKQWTTDSVLVLSSLAKADGFVCAIYDKWSLTWTASWPWEIVTQTTINWDGSTKIYLYYNRNKRTVHLSGDEHVDYLEINGDRDDEAVRECGSEVPVNAIPKPWYHFVRWDREEREGREDDEVDTHSGWTND